MQIEATNNGANAMKTTQALHTYYSVSDISKVSIDGLSNVPFFDNSDGRKKKDGAAGSVQVDGETDRLYSGAGVVMATPLYSIQSQDRFLLCPCICLSATRNGHAVLYDCWPACLRGGDLVGA